MPLIHTCYRILEIDRSVAFYEALGFEEARRVPIRDEAINVFLNMPDDEGDGPRLELTCNIGRTEPYEIGTGYGHIAITAPDLDATLQRLQAAGDRAREAAVPRARGRLAAVLRARPRRLPDRDHRAGRPALKRRATLLSTMADTSKVAKNLERFAQAIAAHDRENPTHTAFGIGMAHFDIERLGFEEGEEILPGITIQTDSGTSGNFRVLCDGQHDDELEEAEEDVVDAVATTTVGGGVSSDLERRSF